MEQRSMAIYSFGEALQYLKIGHRASRYSWSIDDNIYYDEKLNTIYKKTNNSNSPWEKPQTDLLAQDWVVIKSV